jgi:hypothetical protein
VLRIDLEETAVQPIDASQLMGRAGTNEVWRDAAKARRLSSLRHVEPARYSAPAKSFEPEAFSYVFRNVEMPLWLRGVQLMLRTH